MFRRLSMRINKSITPINESIIGRFPSLCFQQKQDWGNVEREVEINNQTNKQKIKKNFLKAKDRNSRIEKKSFFFRFHLIGNNSKNRNWISYYWQYHHVVFICLGIVTSSSWLLRKWIEKKVVRLLLDNQCSGFSINITFRKNSKGSAAIWFLFSES